MNKITPELVQKIEFYSIFLNNFLLLIGIPLFGWTLFETLFLFWLEAIAAVIVLCYMTIAIPLKYGRPGIQYLPEFRTPALKAIGITLAVFILHYFALVFIINLGQVDGWDTTQGALYTLAQMPVQLWKGSLLLLTFVFLLAYLLPPLMLERRGIKPSLEVMPMQSKIMIHPSQFVVCYIWFIGLWVLNQYAGIQSPIALVGALMIVKSIYEAILFFRIKNSN